MKIPVDRLAWFLMASDDACQSELIKETLSNVCRTLKVSAAMVHLLDDATLVVNAEVRIRNGAGLKLTFTPGTSGSADCAIHGAPVVEGGTCTGLLCPSGRCLEDDGFRSHACTPLKLGSTTIGALSALSESPREFSAADIEYMTAKSKQLALGLHHSFYFPELGAEWLELEQSCRGRRADSGTQSESLADRLQLKPDSMAYRVLTLEGCSHVSSVTALAYSLPKGIHWATLHRVCEFLDRSQAAISRRDLSSAIGVSDVTAGHYLNYLVDSGLVRRELAYGRVGRPAIMYRLMNKPMARSPKKADEGAVDAPSSADTKDRHAWPDHLTVTEIAKLAKK